MKWNLSPLIKVSGQLPLLLFIRKMEETDDFKLSVNLFLHSQTYPLPMPEEMFGTLANKESYTKLDLERAYK